MTPLAIDIITTYGKQATAGFGIATRIEMFAMLIINALASIFVPILGRNIGAHKSKHVDEIIKKSVFFSLLYGILAVIILTIFSIPLAKIFSKDLEVLQTIKTYLWIVPLGYGLH